MDFPAGDLGRRTTDSLDGVASGDTDVLLLSEQDVRTLISMDEAIDAVAQAFRALADGGASMPPKVYLQFPQHGGDLRVMPASVGTELAGVKVVNSHPGNTPRGLPAVMGTYVLVSQETGRPLAVMGAIHLTAVRTGAASAVATRHLAREDASTVALIGCGAQAPFQLEAVARVREIERVFVWGPLDDIDRRNALVERLGIERPTIQPKAVEGLQEGIAADILCTTTPSRVPLVMDAWIDPGTHINAVGADGPGKQELDPAILKRAHVIVDEWSQAEHGGEVNVPLQTGAITEQDVDGTLADVVVGRSPGRTSSEQITVFDSTGLALEDIAVASVVYRRALQERRGTLFRW